MIQVLQFLLALSILIVLHEGGHFFFAKLFKTRVEKFYLFFDFLFPFSNILPFSLFKKKVGETTYGIGWFPLGGYVKIAGMVDESMDKEQMKQPPQPWEFRSKKAWQRLLIMLGGIIVNVLLAFLIYAMILFVWGKEKLPMSEVNNHGGIVIADSIGYKLGFKDGDKIVSVNHKDVRYYDDLMFDMLSARTVEVERGGANQTILLPENLVGKIVDNGTKTAIFSIYSPVYLGEVTKGSNAEKAGLLKGDTIISINNQPAKSQDQIINSIGEKKNSPINLLIHRGNEEKIITAQTNDKGKLGIAMMQIPLDSLGYKFETQHYGFFESFPAGVGVAANQLNKYVQQFKLMLNPKTEAYKGLGGFVSMAKIYGPVWDWQRFWSITAMLSIVLAFMNLLPIPGLDGGYVVFTLIEMVTGRKVNEKVLEVATTIGLVFLLALMLYANGNDIFRNFFK